MNTKDKQRKTIVERSGNTLWKNIHKKKEAKRWERNGGRHEGRKRDQRKSQIPPVKHTHIIRVDRSMMGDPLRNDGKQTWRETDASRTGEKTL